MTIDFLQSEAEKDLRLDDSNLIKSSMENGLLISKWLRYYNDIAEELVYCQNSINRIECLLTLYYKGKANEEQLKLLNKKQFALKLTTESDVSKFVKSTKEYIEKIEELKSKERLLKYIEEVIQNIKYQHLRVQNIINYKKFLNGE